MSSSVLPCRKGFYFFLFFGFLMGFLQTTSYLHMSLAPPVNRTVNASSQQCCKEKYIKYSEFSASN